MSERFEAVPPVLRRLLKRLAEIGATRDFYLAGGTGVALLRHHRRSVDLDFFSRTNRLDGPGRRTLLTLLKRLPGWIAIETHDGTVQGRMGRVRVSFFWYPEPLMGSLVRQGPIRIASLPDIGLMKLGAIIGRGSRKDFVDLYTICQELPLSQLLALAPKKFRDAGDVVFQALKALTFFEDAEREPPLLTPAPVAWDRVKKFFVREVRIVAHRYLKR